MGVLDRVSRWLTPTPWIEPGTTVTPSPPERTRSHEGESWDVQIIDGVAVPGLGMLGSGAYRGGMSVPGAWRCALILSDLLGEVPWHAYRKRAGDPVEMLDPTPPVLDQPNPQETRMSTISSWALDLVWHGDAIGIVAARNAEGWPSAILPVPARMVHVRRELGPSNLPVGTILYNVGGIVFPQWDVFHVKGPHEPGEVQGMGVLEAHFDTLGLAREQRGQAWSVAHHGVPTGKLTTTNQDTTKEELREAKEAWMAAQRERTVAALSPGTDFEPIAWNPEELQLVEARKFTLHELGLIFGLPLSFLGVETSNRTYRNDETEAINLLKFALSGHLTRFEQTFTMHLPRGTWAKANVDSILRSDTLTRYQAHKIAIASRFLTVDEVRELEDRPPLDDEPDDPPPTDDDESPEA